MTTLQQYIDFIKDLVSDDGSVRGYGSKLLSAIESARREHSVNRKLRKVVEVTATTGRMYALPSGWELGFSEGGYQIEYPVDDNAEQVQYLRAGMTELYNSPTGTMIRFRELMNNEETPGSGEKFRVHFNTTYALNSTSVTIPASDAIPVCDLAAARLCFMLVSHYSNVAQQAAPGSQQVEYRAKADNYVKLGETYLQMYNSAIKPAGGVKAAFVMGEFVDDPQHRSSNEEFFRDSSGRQRVDY